VSMPGATPSDNAFLLPAGEHDIFIAVGHQSLSQPRRQAWTRPPCGRIRVCEPANRARALVAGVLEPFLRFLAGQATGDDVVSERLLSGLQSSPARAVLLAGRRVWDLSRAGGLPSAGLRIPSVRGAQFQSSRTVHGSARAPARDPAHGPSGRRDTSTTSRGALPLACDPGLLPYLPGHSNEGAYLHEHHVNGWLAEAVRRYLQANGWERSQIVRYYPVLREIARFFSSMLTPRGNELEIAYVPSCGQEESNWDLTARTFSTCWCRPSGP